MSIKIDPITAFGEMVFGAKAKENQQIRKDNQAGATTSHPTSPQKPPTLTDDLEKQEKQLPYSSPERQRFVNVDLTIKNFLHNFQLSPSLSKYLTELAKETNFCNFSTAIIYSELREGAFPDKTYDVLRQYNSKLHKLKIIEFQRVPGEGDTGEYYWNPNYLIYEDSESQYPHLAEGAGECRTKKPTIKEEPIKEFEGEESPKLVHMRSELATIRRQLADNARLIQSGLGLSEGLLQELYTTYGQVQSLELEVAHIAGRGGVEMSKLDKAIEKAETLGQVAEEVKLRKESMDRKTDIIHHQEKIAELLHDMVKLQAQCLVVDFQKTEDNSESPKSKSKGQQKS